MREQLLYRFIQGRLSLRKVAEQMLTYRQAILDESWGKADKGVFELLPEESHK